MLNKMIKNKKNKGVTLVESIIVITIIVILTAVMLPQFSKIKNLQIVKNASLDIVSSLNKAQSQTRASLNSSSYGVHFESNRIIIFRGTSYVANDSVNNTIIDIIQPAVISNISLSGGAMDLYFYRLSGLPSRTGTIVVSISGNASLTKTITISATGMASIN